MKAVGSAVGGAASMAKAATDKASEAANVAASSANKAGAMASTAANKTAAMAEAGTGVAGSLAKGSVNVAAKGADMTKGVTKGAVGMVGSGIADQILEIKDAVVARQAVPQLLIDAPTPEDRWFTPAAGWPAAPAELPAELSSDPKVYKSPPWKPPQAICPTAEQMPHIFEAAEQQAIGEVRVEVLQAEELPKLLVGVVDPYAVIVFEGFAGR